MILKEAVDELEKLGSYTAIYNEVVVKHNCANLYTPQQDRCKTCPIARYLSIKTYSRVTVSEIDVFSVERSERIRLPKLVKSFVKILDIQIY